PACYRNAPDDTEKTLSLRLVQIEDNESIKQRTHWECPLFCSNLMPDIVLCSGHATISGRLHPQNSPEYPCIKAVILYLILKHPGVKIKVQR
ncbi:MAG: hypothetical protein RR219_09750, partial [Clostridiales bacterium]